MECYCVARKEVIDLSRIPLQCVQTIEPERGSGGHFRTFTVFLSTRTSPRCHCSLECGKGLLQCRLEETKRETATYNNYGVVLNFTRVP